MTDGLFMALPLVGTQLPCRRGGRHQPIGLAYRTRYAIAQQAIGAGAG